MARKWLTPEEVELADVERQMEEQLVAQHRLVDRVIAQRSEPDGSLRFLAKVRSQCVPNLPHGIDSCPFL